MEQLELRGSQVTGKERHKLEGPSKNHRKRGEKQNNVQEQK